MIERTKINGLPATVCYLDDGMNPTDKANCTCAKAVFDNGDAMFMVASPILAPPPAPPKVVPKPKRILAAHQQAIRILDESEIPMRDTIERDLAPMRGKGAKITKVQKMVDQLMARIKPIRTAAFKKAFRHLRDNAR